MPEISRAAGPSRSFVGQRDKADDLDEQRRRLGVAQVEALFGSILIATATASATSVFIAAGLISLGFVALGTGLAWVIYLHAFGICNLALRRLYLRSRPVGDRWRVWAIGFTAINFAVGVGFGWARSD